MAAAAVMVRILPSESEDPNDLCGMAVIPTASLRHEESKAVDPLELARKLRELTPESLLLPENERAEAAKLREALIAAGGRPSRPLRDFKPCQANAESVELYGTEHGLFELYRNERRFWDDELRSWQYFLKRRMWEFERRRRRELAEESLPNPKDMDQVELFSEYLACQRARMERFEQRRGFKSRCARQALMDRLHAIEQQRQVVLQEQNPMTEGQHARISHPSDLTRGEGMFAHNTLPPQSHHTSCTSRGTKRGAHTEDDCMPGSKRRASSRRIREIEDNSLRESISSRPKGAKTHASSKGDRHRLAEKRSAAQQNRPVSERSVAVSETQAQVYTSRETRLATWCSSKARTLQPSTLHRTSRVAKSRRLMARGFIGTPGNNSLPRKSSLLLGTASKILRRSARIATIRRRRESTLPWDQSSQNSASS